MPASMSDPDSVEINHGFPDPRTLIGKTIILRPRRDVGFPLVVGLICGLLALGLLAAVVLAFQALINGALLAVLELLIGLALAWFASLMLADAVAHQRFNRRRPEFRLALDRVELHTIDGLETITLTDASTHPLLRSLPIDARLHTLLRARATCKQLPRDADQRVILESLALFLLESPTDDLDDPPPEQPLFAIILRPGEVNFFHDPDDLADARASGLPLYRVRSEWDPLLRIHIPQLNPAAISRISP